MTIKEVEKLIGITSANIRFYEKEQLIVPARDTSNNYRQYTQEEVDRLRKIKFLRTLGVSVLDIKKIIEGDCALGEIVEQRRAQIQKEEENLKELQVICGEILERQMEFTNLDASLLNEESKEIQSRLKAVLNEDTSQIEVTPKEFNGYIWKWLTGAFLLDAIICLFGVLIIFLVNQNRAYPIETAGFILEHLKVILSIVSIVAVFIVVSFIWTAKMWALYMNYILSALLLPAFVLIIYGCIYSGVELNLLSAGIFFGEVTVFVLILGAMISRFEKLKQNCAYGIIFSMIFSGIMTAMHWCIFDDWIFWSVCILIQTMYVSLNWILSSRYRTDFSKYAGIVSAISIVNVLGNMYSGEGHTRSWWRGRDEIM